MAKAEDFPFGKEVTNHLYRMSIRLSDAAKEIFLWELVMNAAKALFKIRCESLFDKSRLAAQPELFIHIVPDKTNNTLSIIDSGVGMTKDDLVIGLCGIPKYTRKKHMRTIEKYSKPDATASGADVDLSCLYGGNLEYGLGFFSAYMVANKVVITTKRNDDEQYVWESNGCGSFSVALDNSGDHRLVRGTKVTLSLKDDQLEYLEEGRLKDLVNKYAKVICPYPISVSVDENKNPTEKQNTVDDIDNKENEDQWKILKQRFEGLRKIFKKVLGQKVKKVVVSDRLFEVSSFLSADLTTFEINPRSLVMEGLRKVAEANPKDEKLKAVVFQQFQAGVANIWLFKTKYGTTNL